MSDFKTELVKQLKIDGVELAEDAVELVVKAVFTTTKAIIKASPTKWDDLALPIIPLIEKIVYPLIDKIDGKIEPIMEHEKV